MTQPLNNLSEIIDRFDYFIIDLWGVLHDGVSPYPYSVECLKTLNESGKKIILLSNAPRRSFKAKEVLDKLGFQEDFYDKLLTSGEVTYNYVKESYPNNSKYIYIGPEKDRDLLNGLDMQEVVVASEADFAVATGFEGFGSVFEEKKDQLDECLAANITLLCANPDRKVVKQTGEEQICAGLMGEYYEANGGKVEYFGKPYEKAYQNCLDFFDRPENREKILCIGDSFHTDIEGGNNIDAKTLITACGIYSSGLIDENGEVTLKNIENLLENRAQVPDYIIEQFRF